MNQGEVCSIHKNTMKKYWLFNTCASSNSLKRHEVKFKKKPKGSQRGTQHFSIHKYVPMLHCSPVNAGKALPGHANALNDTWFPNLALLFSPSLRITRVWIYNVFIYIGKLEKAVCTPEGDKEIGSKRRSRITQNKTLIVIIIVNDLELKLIWMNPLQILPIHFPNCQHKNGRF